MIYLHENGVTVVATDEAKRGKVYELNGEKYYVARGVADIKRIVDSGEHPLNRVITSKLTSLNFLFQIRGGWQNKAVPDNFNDDISNWDTSNVLSMDEVFSGWPKFNGDISKWDTSRVESMYGMFKSSKYVGSHYMGDTSFDQDISKWDVSNVKNMSEMFLGATSFNQDISNWDVSNVENMDYMFSGATSFNQDISKWDVSNVKSMSNMFSNVTSIGIVAFVGTYEYTTADSTSFNQDISKWDVRNVENMENMFSGATSFNQDISKWDVSNVVYMSGMFKGATSFNQPIGNWNLSKGPGMGSMFGGATSFNQDISKWNVSKVAYMGGMFSGATSFNQDISKWDVRNVKNMSEMFQGATSFNQDLNGWEVSSLSDQYSGCVEGMFYGATSFNSPIGKWNFKSITSMENMFREATAFNQDISSWDVSNVTQMKGLFQDATSFNQDLRSWKLNKKLPKSRTMFTGATAFNIKEYNPFLNKKAKKREVDTSTANLSSDDKKTISKIKKFLISRDLDQIDMGIELLISLNNKELFESLLHECKITNSDDSYNNQKLICNKTFTGSGPAQPYLNYSLFNVIANAPSDVEMDDSIKIKNMIYLDTDTFSLKDGWTRCKRFLNFEKFTSLKSLRVDFGDFDLDEVNLDEVFKNNYVEEISVKNPGESAKWFKNFTQIKSLSFESSNGIKDFDNFKLLENLEYLDLSSGGIKNLDFIKNCSKIREIKLSIHATNEYVSGRETKFENIDVVKHLKNLQSLYIIGLKGDLDLSVVNSCKNLKLLSLKSNHAYDETDNIDLSILNNKNIETLIYDGKVSEIDGAFTEIGVIKGLKKLKNITIGAITFKGIKDTSVFGKFDPKILKSDFKIRATEELLIDDGNIIKYKGEPFTGTYYCQWENHWHRNSFIRTEEDLLSCEIEYQKGLKHGSFKEFYKLSNKLRIEKIYHNNEAKEIIGFYDEDGNNLIENKKCYPSRSLNNKGNSFYYKNKLFSGLVYLEIMTDSLLSYGNKENNEILYTNPLQEFLSNYSLPESEYDNGNFFKNNNPHSHKNLIIILNLNKGEIEENMIVSSEGANPIKIKTVNRDEIKDSPLHSMNVITEENSDGMANSFSGDSIVVTGVFKNYSRNELKEIIESKGGKPSSSVTKNTSFILAGEKMGPKKKNIAEDLGITLVSEDEFISKYISAKQSDESEVKSQTFGYGPSGGGEGERMKEVKTKPKLTSEERKSFSEIKKLLKERDLKKIDKGIEMLKSINNTELFETLLNAKDGPGEQPCSVSSGVITPNYFFKGNTPAQYYLDYALINVIANCPQDAEIKESLYIKNITSFGNYLATSEEFRDDYYGATSKFPPVNMFKSITNFHFNMGKALDENFDVYFKDNNIEILKIEGPHGDIKWLKNFSKLLVLDFDFGYSRKFKSIESFENLVSLENLILTKIKGVKNLDFLRKSKNIKKLDLHFEDYGDDSIEENINVVKNFKDLEELEITNLKSGVNIDSIALCKKLRKLTISLKRNNDFNIDIINKCKSLEELSITGIKIGDVKGKISDLVGLKKLPNLKSIQIRSTKITSSDNKSIFL